MLKTTVLSQILITNKMFTANEVGDIKGVKELIEKSGKLSKTGKLSKSGNSKSEKLSEFQNMAKSGKKLSKSRISPNFNAKKIGLSFLNSKARTTFNFLWLAFTKAPILQHFDSECHIWIKINVLGYAIGRLLNQLTFGISPNGVVIKDDLGQWH